MFEWNSYTENKGFSLQDALDNWQGVRIDPYMVWAFSTNFEYLEHEGDNDDITLPLIIELCKSYNRSNAEEVIDRIMTGSEESRSNGTKIHQILPKTKFVTGRFPASTFFEKLKSLENAGLIERFELGLPTKVRKFNPNSDRALQTAAKSVVAERGSIELESFDTQTERVPPIIGIIDDGIAFLNQRFQNSDMTSRIQILWDQNKTEENPEGRLINQSIINELIEKCYDGSETYATMEELIYTQEQMPNLIRRVSHGTHLLDIAAGEERTDAADEFNEILAVRLPQPDRRFSDTSGLWLKVSVFEALQFLIFEANKIASSSLVSADELKRDLVVNLSFGNLSGSHDGSSILERGIDFLIGSAPDPELNLNQISVHIASGNQRQAQCYAHKDVPPNESQTFHWRILPDDATPSFLELWFDNDIDLQNLQIEIKPPVNVNLSDDSDGVFDVGSGVCKVLSDVQDIPVCTYISLPKEKIATGDKPMVLVAVTPTGYTASRQPAPAGTWEIVIHNNNANEVCEVNARIQRDDTTTAGPIRGRQSYFDDPDYQKVDSFGYPVTPCFEQEGYVQLDDTVNGISTGEQVSTIGSYRYSGRTMVGYSGFKEGLDNGTRDDRYFHTISEDSLTCEGVIATGTRSGSRVALNGTSVANAVATGYRFRQGKIESSSFENSSGGEFSVEDCLSTVGRLKPTNKINDKLRRVQVRR